MAKTKKETIKALLIIPLGLTILILLATSIIALHKLHDHHINQESRKSLNELNQLFQMELNEDADKLAGIIEFLQKDKDLQNAWLARDRQSLLGYALPIFEGIRSRHHVTHFYFHSLDSVNFLRVHKPKRHGDHIDRFTMKQAASSGKDSWGIELGPLGLFTLRYVYPWQIDGKLVGYIELGEDIEMLTPELANLSGSQLIFLIDKSYLNRADWEQGMEMLRQTGNWDQYANFIISHRSMKKVPPKVNEFLGKLQDCKSIEHRQLNFNASLDKHKYRVDFLPLIDAGGQDIGDIIVLKDITELQASLNRLLISGTGISGAVGIFLLVFFYMHVARIERRVKLVKPLELKNQEMHDIVHTASHDLRSPLATIDGFSNELKYSCDNLLELLAEQSDCEDKKEQIELLIKEEIPQALKFIIGSSKKMGSLLDGLLQVSRVGAVEIHSESLDVNNSATEVLKSMEYQIKENNITATVETLPGCIGDTHMLDHVFTNLISNAIKYRDLAKESEIKISGWVEGGMSTYCVEDNGIGIATRHQKNVFEIFHRLDPHDSAGGEGLGLTIVTRLMARMDGKIWLESEVGKGSKFFIALPAA